VRPRLDAQDAISHFNPDRPDLSINAFPIEHCFAEGVWIDVPDVPPRTHITLERVRRALDEAGVDGLPAGGAWTPRRRTGSSTRARRTS
jgi:kynurenine formamidase